MTLTVGKVPVINERFNKLPCWSEISFLSSFNTLVGILHGPVVLLIYRDDRISFCFFLWSVSERKKELGFSFVR